jgi:hypothetical protein
VLAGAAAVGALVLGSEPVPMPAIAFDVGLDVPADDATLDRVAALLRGRFPAGDFDAAITRRGDHVAVAVRLRGGDAASIERRLRRRRDIQVRPIVADAPALCALVRAVRAGVGAPRMEGFVSAEGAPGRDCAVRAGPTASVVPPHERLHRLIAELTADGSLPPLAPGQRWVATTGSESAAHVVGAAIDLGPVWVQGTALRAEPPAGTPRLAVALSPSAREVLAMQRRAGVTGIAIVDARRFAHVVALASAVVPAGLDVGASRADPVATRDELEALRRQLALVIDRHLVVGPARPTAR